MCILQKTIPVLLSVQRLSADCALLHVPFLLPSEKPCSLSDSSKEIPCFLSPFLQVLDESTRCAYNIFFICLNCSDRINPFHLFLRSAIMQVNSAKEIVLSTSIGNPLKQSYQPQNPIQSNVIFLLQNLHYPVHIRIFFF